VRPPRTSAGEGAWDPAGVALYGAAGSVLLFLLLPIFVIVPISFSSAKFLTFPPPGWSLQWYVKYFTSPAWIGATWLSLKVAVLTMVLATVLGTLAALGLTRGRFPGRGAVYGVALAPMIIPVIITAIGIYFLFSRYRLTGTLAGLALAHTVLAIPVVVVIVAATLHGVDRNLEFAAMNLGASRARTFWAVTLPVIRPGVISAAIFAFIVSFDEVIVAMFLSSPTTATLPKQMWDGIRQEIDPTIAAVSTLLIFGSVMLLLLAEVLRRQAERLTERRVS
jgi:putative spermidine/putrescine transport system permease protein